jgi:hypothetical protein
MQPCCVMYFQGLADASRGRGITDGLDPDVVATAAGMIAVSCGASALPGAEVVRADGAPFGVRRHAGDAEESPARSHAFLPERGLGDWLGALDDFRNFLIPAA